MGQNSINSCEEPVRALKNGGGMRVRQRRKPIGNEIQERLWKHLTGNCHNIDVIPVAIGGTDDHVHMLFHLPPSRAPGDAVRLLKTNSSRWMNEHAKGFARQE